MFKLKINVKSNIFGLTGGIGCGKSTVGEFLKKYPDVYVFDCDKKAKDILLDNNNLNKVKSILGESVIVDEKVDSKKVAQIIFSDDKKKKLLEDFIHPKVWQIMDKELQMVGNEKIFIVESAILFEIGKEKDIPKIIVVTCDKDEQIKRIKLRNGWSDKQIKERLKNQLLNEYKEKNGLIVIDNNCSKKKLESKVEQVYFFIKSKKKGKIYF